MNESALVPRDVREENLDWLARNANLKALQVGVNDVFFVIGDMYFSQKMDGDNGARKAITGADVLARRAELQNKPSWEDAPEWAEWLNQDKYGVWNWQRIMAASSDAGGYWFGGGRSEHAGSGEVLGDWRDTLEKRPEQKAFEPFVSVEDAATAKQPDPKGSGNPILGMVLADLTNRALEGKEKYGEPLLAHNGRNPLLDAYQEALDLAMYLRQAIEEQK